LLHVLAAAVPLLLLLVAVLGLVAIARIVAATATVVTAPTTTSAAAATVATTIVATAVALLSARVVVAVALRLATVVALAAAVALRLAATVALRLAATAPLLSLPTRTVACRMPLDTTGVAVATEGRRAGAAGVQDLWGGLGFCLDLLLGELQPGLGLHEGGEGLGQLQELLLELEAFVEAVNELHGEFLLADRGADVCQLIGEALEFVAVGHDAHVALGSVLELLGEEELAALGVGGEEVLQGRPGGVGGAVRLQDNILHLVGDGSVDLEDDVNVGGAPLRVGEVRIGLLLDIITGVVLLEDEEEEVVPLVVVAGGDVKLELDVPRDIDASGGGWGGH
jgi:hypothetical protein